MIDQTKLPIKLEFVKCTTYEKISDCIKNLVIRGAPAIGVAAAMGIALAAKKSKAKTPNQLMHELDSVCKVFRSTRPTAVNLFWALERVMEKARSQSSVKAIKDFVLKEALKMAEEDVNANKQIGAFGAVLIEDGDAVLTHCNAGALATVAYGTALGVLRAAKEQGKHINVIATETRPVLQGSRLTAFELKHVGIDVSVAPDTAIGSLMSRGMIKKVIVGADRVLRTGHVFNKIGTYQVALMAYNHNIPFYVAAPISSFDFNSDPDNVTIEERPFDEVINIGGKRIVPSGVRVFNPAFDLTPPGLISGIITEKGVLTSPYDMSIKTLLE
jgi:methylthioribose-1-phosphate isomerase